MKYSLRSLAIGAGALLASAPGVGAQVPPTISAQRADLAGSLFPFTFDVPIRIETLHRDVRQIAVRCLVYDGIEYGDREIIASGNVSLQADAVLDADGSVSREVTVGASMWDGYEPTAARFYRCDFLLTKGDGPFPPGGLLCSPDRTTCFRPPTPEFNTGTGPVWTIAAGTSGADSRNPGYRVTGIIPIG